MNPRIQSIDLSRPYTCDATGLHIADPANLTIPNTPIHLDLTDPFAALD